MTFIVDAVSLICMRSLVGIMYVLPDRYALVVARTFFRVVRLFVRRLDRVGRKNLELMLPERTAVERERILYQSYEIIACNLVSYAKIPQLTAEKARRVVNCEQALAAIRSARAQSGGTGVILPTLHFGSFELLAQIWSFVDRPFAFLARGTDLPMFDRWWNRRREMFGSRVLWRRGGFREMVDALQAGTDVGVLFDQNVKKHHAVFVEFFGRQAATTKSIALAALRTGAPIIFAVCVDLGDGRYEILARSVPNPSVSSLVPDKVSYRAEK